MEFENLQTSPGFNNELSSICERLKKLGYAESRHIRIYGEEFEVTSNPFPDGTGISVRAVGKHEKQARVVKIPLPVLQTVTPKKAA